MARRVRWKIEFISDNGTNYLIQVTDEGWTGTASLLTPATSPITVQENDDEDFFAPIRTNTGYIRFIDDNANDYWSEMIPNSGMEHFVELLEVHGSSHTVIFQGYIVAQSFDSPWDSVAERELPIHCALAALQGVNWPVENTGIFSIGEFIYDMINATGCHIDTILIPEHLLSPTAFLGKKFSGMNFLSISSNGEVESTDSYYTVLEEICKFFGLTAHVDGTRLFFTQYGRFENRDYYTLNIQTLEVFLREGGTISPVVHPTQTNYLDEMTFYGRQGSKGYLQGKKKLTVEGQPNEIGSLLELPFDVLERASNAKQISSQVVGDKTVFYKRLLSTDYPFYYENGSMDGFISRYNVIGQYDFTETSEITQNTKRNYKFETLIQFGETSYSTPLYIRSRFPVSLQDGMICIKADFSLWRHGYMTAYLKVGGLYWTGSDWDNTYHTFTMNIELDGTSSEPGSATIKTTKALSDPYNGAEGYGIIVGNQSQDMVSGILEFGIVSVGPYMGLSNGYDQFMKSLEIVFVRKDDVRYSITDDNRNKYQAYLENGFSEEWSRSNRFVSDNYNEAGFGIFLNADDSWLDEYIFLNENVEYHNPPEDELINMASFHYDKKAMKLRFSCQNIELDSSMLYETPDGLVLCPISTSHDYIHDLTTVTAIEI